MDKIHLGTMGWSYSFWVEKLYPKGMSSQGFLAEYSKHFNSVEVDNTFYRIPRSEVVAKWREQTPVNFVFSVKFPRLITHEKKLKDCMTETQLFVDRVSQLREKLGPLLLQFPAEFGPDKLNLLKDFLPVLPKEHKYAIEVRNRKLLTVTFRSLLRDERVALAKTDLSSVSWGDIIEGDFAYLRWEGDRKAVKGTLGKTEIDRKKDIREEVRHMRTLLDSQVELFGYFSKYYSGYPPGDVAQLLEFLLQ